MNISVDGGGLCATPIARYGNYTFTVNFLEALSRYDKKNNFIVYSFCNSPIKLSRLRYKKLTPSIGWMKFRVPLEEYMQKNDYYLGLNQVAPFITPAKTILFSHGLSFHKFPHMYENPQYFDTQLKKMVSRSHTIIVSSVRVKNEMLTLFPRVQNKICTIPFGIPFDMKNYKKVRREKYFIYVGMNAPIKNIEFIKKAFEMFKKDKEYADYKLHILTDPSVSRLKLRSLYAASTACLTASHYESFNFPVIEALSQRCPVIGLESALIPEVQPFCSVARTQEEFVERMKKIAQRKTSFIDVKKLKKVFSWKTFVDTLQTVYV